MGDNNTKAILIIIFIKVSSVVEIAISFVKLLRTIFDVEMKMDSCRVIGLSYSTMMDLIVFRDFIA